MTFNKQPSFRIGEMILDEIIEQDRKDALAQQDVIPEGGLEEDKKALDSPDRQVRKIEKKLHE